MTDDQKLKILEYLAVHVLGAKPVPGGATPVYAVEFEPEKFSAIAFSLDPWVGHPNPPVKWNPFESADDALGLLLKCREVDIFDRCWRIDLERFCETATLACYRAAGGPDVD